MNFTGLLFLLLTQYLSGRGFVKLFRLQLSFIALTCLSMICGVMLVSFVPCVQQLLHIPLTEQNTYIDISVMTVLFSIPLVMKIKQTKMPGFSLPKLYEIPFILVFLFLAITSVWRCFYFPPTPRDVLTGTELIAEYAVKENTMLNSVFSIDLRLNSAANNIFKSPFITGLQIVYKQLVQPFGELWLSVIFLSFTTWFYSLIRERIHPFLASVLMLIFFCIPDLFAYTYIILYDYSNMVFFFAGYYFLIEYLENQRVNYLIWVSVLFGFATYVRSETLVMIGLIALLLAYQLFRKGVPFKEIATRGIIFMSGPLVANFVISSIFIRNFIPIPFSLGQLINPNWMDFSFFFLKLDELTNGLIFSPKGTQVYAHFFYFFLGVLVIDVIWPRRFNPEAKMSLWLVVIIYFSLTFLSYIIPSHTVVNSAKRGLFKILPVMVFYMANSGILQRISEFLKRKESGIKAEPEPKRVAATAMPKQKIKGKK